MSFTDVISNPPATPAEWDRINRREHYLHLKWPKRILQMHRTHKKKAILVEEDYQSHVDHPGYYRKIYMDGGLSLSEANSQILVDTSALDTMRKRLKSIVKCCRVEYEIRQLLIAGSRHPVEPDEPDTVDETDLPVEVKTIVSIDSSIVRNPTG